MRAFTCGISGSKAANHERCDSSLDRVPAIDHDGILDMTGIRVVHHYDQGKWLDIAVSR
jgi:hypothetical protein